MFTFREFERQDVSVVSQIQTTITSTSASSARTAADGLSTGGTTSSTAARAFVDDAKIQTRGCVLTAKTLFTKTPCPST